MKYTTLCGDIRRKLGNNDKVVQQDYFQTQNEVLIILIKRNLASDNNSNQSNIVSVIESYIEKFQKEPNFILFLNIIEFQETISLLFAFFLKLSSNYHKIFIEFCRLRATSHHVRLLRQQEVQHRDTKSFPYIQ